MVIYCNNCVFRFPKLIINILLKNYMVYEQTRKMEK